MNQCTIFLWRLASSKLTRETSTIDHLVAAKMPTITKVYSPAISYILRAYGIV